MRATFGCAQNASYLDTPCHHVLRSLMSLPPTVVTPLEDMIEFQMYGIHIERPVVGGAHYVFQCTTSGNVSPKIITYQGRPRVYRLPPCNDPQRFDRVTIEKSHSTARHFLLRPDCDGVYPFSRATIYTDRVQFKMIYNDKEYIGECRKSWRFPSRGESGFLYFTRQVDECFIDSPDDNEDDLLTVVSMCTPPVFGRYFQDV